MRAIIPAAGFGTRLKPHTFSLPKVLLNVGGKPILGHIIDKLLSEQITKATFVVGYLGEKIVEYVNNEYPELEASFVTQEIALGLGHAIHMAVPTFDHDEIFIILGDTIFDVNIHSVFEKKISSLGVKTVDDPSRFGVAVCENDKIVKLIEKPQEPISKLALVGLYYIRNSKLLVESLNELFEKEIKTRGEYQLTDALQLMIDKGEEFSTFQVDGWYDCGKSETLLSTNKYILQTKGTNRNVKGSTIIDPVYISDSAVVLDSVIGPFTTISEHCVVKESIIKNSILSPSSQVEKSMLDNSIIGMNAIIKGNYKKLNAGDSSEIEFY
ncbi:MAG: nucleotidyl transferase [Stygiobacter sp. RIFOXYC12_FULL_38_8]|nr:MAG: nucleotidyl transferase [Stygiobacter sp. RIFOXYA12_FULL_38_9]OGV06981.1 MAG: nucleotidyl transferase [Stygiobacter sp. RIFOXYB2_FULL_37_11]OGV12008.1 MAG: nucleotidyl transferase [Stygiobacter sp. RIFOXYA2_FULL_38_8]OGV14442.1 MAG: nucleotidyl transferase [Stygiobacter sp. RIFOXYC2_FULL_38_25]OGV29879.1 MAG: nucleotidyl transferase [Stygiobacter sp. RIFOXYC12_FULL_38_8]OGV82202.1 MAG: nucleotidyl transferase [Stygiobacter sp. GWF2_38_21]